MKKNRNQNKRRLYFRFLKKLMRIRYKEPEFVYLGGEIEPGSIILSNHEGTDAPMAFELYHDSRFRMWGAHEMNSGLISMYKYQTRVYYHEKKKWNIHLARLFCLIASPLTNLFYKGFNLISTYHDTRFVKTIRESISTLQDGVNVIIYPEDSSNGYLPELEGFHAGFTMLCKQCCKRGVNAKIYVAYFKKNENKYIIDKPVTYSELMEKADTKEDVAKILCDRCNELGKMNTDNLKSEADKSSASHIASAV